MEIPAKYDPTQREDKWYAYWLKHKLFKSEPDQREPYTIVIPPPNVTGVLHMGHMLNNTLQDVLVRRARMKGYNACWVPGTDHASIATEAKVVAKLRSQGIKKSELTRKEFLQHAYQWKDKHGGIILQQLRKLGASCDWDRTNFTMDKDYYDSVIDVFIDLYNKDKIYRGVRMVNWDPQAKTAVSDEEVIYKEVQSKLYYVRYQIQGENNQWLTIATTRPETILGDTGICINPKDTRFEHLKGKKAIVPLVNRIVPIIEDEYVDMDFGTGCLKITPAHDINDYELGNKHNLEVVDILNDDGTLSEKAQLYVGQDRFEVRKKILKDLEKAGHIVKIEEYVNKVGFSERTDAVIEPKLSMQWFVKMKELSRPALENVMNDNIKLHPEKFKNTYRHWMENVRDWCISRQLWWGQRIPVFYIKNTNQHVVAKTPEQALKLAQEKTGNKNLQIEDLKQDPDVLDTWFSSWLWPISVFNGLKDPQNKDIQYYYPTNDLVTAPEILFFWVARMIIAGYEYRNQKPFENVYLTGIVRDTQGRKMSKSLGNSPDPLGLIEKYGADGVRVGMLLCSPAGNDLLFDKSLPEQGRNFGNKIWNAFRLIKQWKTDNQATQPQAASLAIQWFENRLNKAIEQIEKQFDQYRLSEALMTIYRLFWDEFSAWYLEIIKPAFGQAIDPQTLNATTALFEKMLKLLHPFMPFITEEIWQLIQQRKDGESISIAPMPQSKGYDEKLIQDFGVIKSVITNLRKIRTEKNIAFKEPLQLLVKAKSQSYPEVYNCIIEKSNNLSEVKLTHQKPQGAASFLVGTAEFFVPLHNLLNAEEEIAKLQKELHYQQGFLKSVSKKLANQRFVQNAPAKVVENEKKKQADAQTKIKALEAQIEGLKN